MRTLLCVIAALAALAISAQFGVPSLLVNTGAATSPLQIALALGALSIRPMMGIAALTATLLADERTVSAYFEAVVAAYGSDAGKPQRVANWLTGEFFRLLYADGDGTDIVNGNSGNDTRCANRYYSYPCIWYSNGGVRFVLSGG